jgi:hypothetical protein
MKQIILIWENAVLLEKRKTDTILIVQRKVRKIKIYFETEEIRLK